LDHGRKFKIDKGSYAGEYRLEFDYVTIHITHPGTRPLEPQIPSHYNIPNPVEPGYILGDHPDFKGRPYIEYLMSAHKEPGEDYTYGSRLCGHEFFVWPDGENHIVVDQLIDHTLDQIDHVITTYKTYGYRNNQMVLQIAQPQDLLLNDPPCLRHIDTRIQDGKLHFFPYFRSWDLWGGCPSNLAAIQILKEYMAAEIGVEDGEIIANSKGLHIYQYVFELAQIRRGIC
jgi:thymidylate synthase